MNLMDINVAEPIVFLCLAALFVLLFLVIHKAIKFSSFFKGATSAVVAACVSLLSVIGLMRTFTIGKGGTEVANSSGKSGSLLDIVLIPYAAMALAILLTLILLYLSKFSRGREAKKDSEEHILLLKKEEIVKKQNEDRLTK